jgi:hypothetical protein
LDTCPFFQYSFLSFFSFLFLLLHSHYDDLEVTSLEETSSLAVHSLRVMDQAREMARHVLRFSV